MKGDFSRISFRPQRHYAAVMMQQGRVQTDADATEAQLIHLHRDDATARDVIGSCGAPKDEAGFEITSDGNTLFIGPGRYYVDGILCENTQASLEYGAQPDLPGATMDDIRKALEEHQTNTGIVYLDVWRRHVTALEDPLLRERALGGPDTATRLQTIWQVRILPVRAGGNTDKRAELEGRVADAKGALADINANRDPIVSQISLVQEQMASLLNNPLRLRQLQRSLAQLQAKLVELDATVKEASDTLAAAEAELAALGPAAGPSCDSDFSEWAALAGISTGTLNARTQPVQDPQNACLLPPSAGYRRLENQLYRVEVHRSGALGTATFKWSRENGSVVSRITRITGSTIEVADLGRDTVLGFRPGDWVEIYDDALELQGAPGQLGQIDQIDETNLAITLRGAAPQPLSADPDGVDPLRHPRLRRWMEMDEQTITGAEDGIVTNGAWQALEGGIEVQFGAGDYRTGDYWMIPARAADGEIEWPPYAVPNLNPIAQPAPGVQHHFCRLALIQLVDRERLDVVGDCRRIFCPLVDVRCATKALHVVGTNWRNDDLFRIQGGTVELRITLDEAPDPLSISDASVMVSLELPFVANNQAVPGAFVTVQLDGDVAPDPAEPRTIVWRFQPAATPGAVDIRAGFTAVRTQALAAVGVARTLANRITVTLKGSRIWRTDKDGVKHLDGQAFGVPGLRTDNKTPCTALVFPSGDDARASDFQSWFFIGAAEQPTGPLQITTVRFLGPDRNQVRDPIAVPLPAGQSVNVSPAGKPRFIELAFNRPFLKDRWDQAPLPAVLVLGRQPVTIAVDAVVDAQTVRLVVTNPDVLVVGSWRLVVQGDPSAGVPTPPLTADDGTALDGDYSGQPGGNFGFAFTVD